VLLPGGWRSGAAGTKGIGAVSGGEPTFLPGGWSARRYWYDGSRGRTEMGTSGAREWKWRRSNPSRLPLHPLRVRGSRRNERARRRGDGRQKHDSGDDFLFPRGSTGNGLTRHGSFSAQGVSKRQHGMEVGAAPTGLALPVDEAGIPAVLRHPKEPSVSSRYKHIKTNLHGKNEACTTQVVYKHFTSSQFTDI